MIRIMVCAPRPDGEDNHGVADSLSETGYAVESFSDGARFLEAAVANPPDLVVYALRAEIDGDLGVLRLLRRAQPGVKLILLARRPSLETRSAVQPLRPVFYSMGPPDPAEVIEVVQAALRRRDHPV